MARVPSEQSQNIVLPASSRTGEKKKKRWQDMTPEEQGIQAKKNADALYDARQSNRKLREQKHRNRYRPTNVQQKQYDEDIAERNRLQGVIGFRPSQTQLEYIRRHNYDIKKAMEAYAKESGDKRDALYKQGAEFIESTQGPQKRQEANQLRMPGTPPLFDNPYAEVPSLMPPLPVEAQQAVDTAAQLPNAIGMIPGVGTLAEAAKTAGTAVRGMQAQDAEAQRMNVANETQRNQWEKQNAPLPLPQGPASTQPPTSDAAAAEGFRQIYGNNPDAYQMPQTPAGVNMNYQVMSDVGSGVSPQQRQVAGQVDSANQAIYNDVILPNLMQQRQDQQRAAQEMGASAGQRAANLRSQIGDDVPLNQNVGGPPISIDSLPETLPQDNTQRVAGKLYYDPASGRSGRWNPNKKVDANRNEIDGVLEPVTPPQPEPTGDVPLPEQLPIDEKLQNKIDNLTREAEELERRVERAENEAKLAETEEERDRAKKEVDKLKKEQERRREKEVETAFGTGKKRNKLEKVFVDSFESGKTLMSQIEDDIREGKLDPTYKAILIAQLMMVQDGDETEVARLHSHLKKRYEVHFNESK